MRIGALVVGQVGKTFAFKLSASAHDVKVANSRGLETIAADVLAFGASLVSTAEAVEDADVVINSIPLPFADSIEFSEWTTSQVGG